MLYPSSTDGSRRTRTEPFGETRATDHEPRQQTKDHANPPDLLPGTLDMLILRVLATESMHGYGIAQRLRDISKDFLQVGESSLLHRSRI